MAVAPVLPLRELAAINPRFDRKLEAGEMVSFVPMAAVNADQSVVREPQQRPYQSVAKGYTPFLSGDILVAKITPCFENGKVAQALLGSRYGFGSTEFHVVRPYEGRGDPRYVLHFLRRSEIRTAGERRMTGSAGQRRVPESFLRELEVPVPALEEQRRIAAILDQAEALQAQRRAAMSQVDELADAIFAEMFGDVAANNRGWPEGVCLGDVADIVSGVTKGRKLPSAKVRSVPYLAVANVQDKSLRLDALKWIDATEEEIARYRLLRDDLVLTEGGDPDKLGRGSLWREELPECIHQNHIFRVRLRSDSLTPVFLNWLVGSRRGKKYFLRSAKQTTGIASINMTQLRNFPLLVPPRSLQDEFSRRLEGVERLRAGCAGSARATDSLFASLQHRAFSGQL